MSERSVPVMYQNKRKLVKVNFASFEKVVCSIGQRLKVTGMQLFGKRSKNEEYFDIDDDGDLEGLEDAEGLVLLVKDLSLDDGGPSRQQRGEGDQATGCKSSCQDFLGEKDTASLRYTGSSSAAVADKAGGSPYSPSGVAPGMPYQGYPTASGDGMPYAVPVYEKPPEYAKSDVDRSLGAESAQDHATINQATYPMSEVVKPVVTEDMALVVVDEVEYSITEIPGSQSKIVMDALATLERDLNIPSISEKLNEVEECLRIAYYASMENKELHGRTQTMQIDIEKLCAECDTVMLKIKVKAANILNELQCGFGKLIGGFKNVGLERLRAVGPIAEEIQKEVKGLNTLLNSREEDLNEILAQVGYRDEDAIAAEEERKKMEWQTRQKRVDERSKDIEKSESQILIFIAEMKRTAFKAASQHLKSTKGNGLIPFGFSQSNKSRAEQEERIARETREVHGRERERLDKLKEEEKKAKIELDAFVARMDAQPKEMSEVAIQGTQIGIKTLTSFLQFFADFWKGIGVAFEILNYSAFINDLTKFRLSDPESKEPFWTSENFKLEAINYVARFVAIQAMCDDFHEKMTKVLRDIQQCMRDKHTADEAKAKLPNLVQQFREPKNQNGVSRQQECIEGNDPDIDDLA